MEDYKTYTNSELEEEIEILKQKYNTAQEIVLTNYKIMMEAAEKYGVAEEILNTRLGKKKEG